MELVLRVAFSLMVVLGLIWFLARLARRSGGQRKEAGGLTVLERRQLTRSASVAIVRVAGKALVLGITDAHVSMLAEADLAEITKAADEPPRRTPVPVQARTIAAPIAAPEGKPGKLSGSALSPQTWGTAIEVLRARTVRK